MSEDNIYAALKRAQDAVVVPKARRNEFGGFNFRSLEDIEAALTKPCADNNLVYTFSDAVITVGDRYYVQSTVYLRLTANPTGGTIEATSFAREADQKKGCDPSQVTGGATSYARKYALCAMFAIDEGSDPDAANNAKQAQGSFTAHCKVCGARYQFSSAEQMKRAKCRCAQPSWVVE